MPNFVVLCFKEIVNIICHIRFIIIEGKHRFVKCDADTYKHYYIFLNKTKFHSYNHLTPHPSHIPPRKSSIYWLAVESLKYHRRHQSVRRITRTDRAECVTLMALSSLSAIPTIAPPPNIPAMKSVTNEAALHSIEQKKRTQRQSLNRRRVVGCPPDRNARGWCWWISVALELLNGNLRPHG